MDNLLLSLVTKRATKHELVTAFPSKSYDAIYRRLYKLRVDSGHLPKPKTGAPRERSKPGKPTAERRCMTCNAPFMSDGPGNRLCPTHRRESDDGSFRIIR